MGKGDENPIGVSQIDSHGWVILAIGFRSLVHRRLRPAWHGLWLGSASRLRPFAIYRIILGAAVLYWAAHVTM